MSKRFLINCIDYRYDNLVTQYYNSIGYTVVDIINHQDCGAFKVFLPTSGYPSTLGANNTQEILIHQRALLLAKSQLNKKYSGLTIHLKIIDINGSVALLNQTTLQWELAYKGSGTNPLGLWWNLPIVLHKNK